MVYRRLPIPRVPPPPPRAGVRQHQKRVLGRRLDVCKPPGERRNPATRRKRLLEPLPPGRGYQARARRFRRACTRAVPVVIADNPRPSVAHSSGFTAIFVPSDCTLILRPVLRLFAVNHQPVADLLPLFTLKPFSSSRFCVPHMSDARGANSASRPLVEFVGVRCCDACQIFVRSNV